MQQVALLLQVHRRSLDFAYFYSLNFRRVVLSSVGVGPQLGVLGNVDGFKFQILSFLLSLSVRGGLDELDGVGRSWRWHVEVLMSGDSLARGLLRDLRERVVHGVIHFVVLFLFLSSSLGGGGLVEMSHILALVEESLLVRQDVIFVLEGTFGDLGIVGVDVLGVITSQQLLLVKLVGTGLSQKQAHNQRLHNQLHVEYNNY